MKNYWKPAKTSERVLSLPHHTAVAGVICMFIDEAERKLPQKLIMIPGTAQILMYTLKHHLKEKKRN